MSVIQKLMYGLVLPFSTPQSYELAIFRTKRGGVEFIKASCILLASLGVISTSTIGTPMLTPSQPQSLYIELFTRDALENVLRKAQSFLFTQPRRVSTVCHRASGRLVTLCGTFSVLLLSGVCSSLSAGGALGPLSLHNHTKGSPLCRSDESVSVEDSQMSCLLVFHKV